MNEHGETEAAIQARLELEVDAAWQCMDTEGRILYERIPAERTERMRAEVGDVTHVVEQLPIHKQPPHIFRDEETGEEYEVLSPLGLFMRDMNNFYLVFNPDSAYGAAHRQQEYSRRFRILFPGFDEALVNQERVYYNKRVAHGERIRQGTTLSNEVRPEREESHKHALVAAYAIMSQLVDENDKWAKDSDSYLRLVI